MPKLKPRNVLPTMLMKKIISMGANVSVCPLYLPNTGKSQEDLIKGITVAKRLLDKNFKNLSY